MKTYIPFTGFYCSMHDDAITNSLETCYANDRGQLPRITAERLFEAVNYSECYQNYAQIYAAEFGRLLKIDLTFRALHSPKFYNYETDQILVDVSEEEVARIFAATDMEVLAEEIKQRHSSRDGFISFYPNSLEKWLKTPIAEWDQIMIWTLLEAYVITEEGRNHDVDLCLMERVSWQFYPEVQDDRLDRIFSYLRNRSNRDLYK
jgi:hypothetical protein